MRKLGSAVSVIMVLCLPCWVTGQVKQSVGRWESSIQAFERQDQTIARLMSPEGLLVGLSYAPSLHDPDASA